MAFEGFRQEQRRVAVGMASGLIVTASVLWLAASVEPQAVPVRPVADRLQAALTADVFVIVWLAASIANVARHRFFSSDDIGGSSMAPGSKRMQADVAILQNTCEQVLLAVLTHLAFAAVIQRPQTMLWALVTLFCVGRALFWAGYASGARGRALGFALTFYPTVAALALSIGALISARLV